MLVTRIYDANVCLSMLVASLYGANTSLSMLFSSLSIANRSKSFPSQLQSLVSVTGVDLSLIRSTAGVEIDIASCFKDVATTDCAIVFILAPQTASSKS